MAGLPWAAHRPQSGGTQDVRRALPKTLVPADASLDPIACFTAYEKRTARSGAHAETLDLGPRHHHILAAGAHHDHVQWDAVWSARNALRKKIAAKTAAT